MPTHVFLACGLALTGVQGFSKSASKVPPEFLRIAPQSSTLFQCGPTTLSAVLAYHGLAIPETRISAAIYSPGARGTLLTDLAWYARERGFRTELRTGTREDLENALARGEPPIVLLDLGIATIRRPHFTAITGWVGETVRYQGRQPNGVRVGEKKFLRQWQRAGNQYLLVVPAS